MKSNIYTYKEGKPIFSEKYGRVIDTRAVIDTVIVNKDFLYCFDLYYMDEPFTNCGALLDYIIELLDDTKNNNDKRKFVQNNRKTAERVVDIMSTWDRSLLVEIQEGHSNKLF